MSMNAPMRVFVGVGANLGDAVSTVRAALLALDTLPDTRRVASSSLYRSAPVEASGPDYINAAAELHTTLPALALLHRLQAIEQAFGRVRSVPNAPRTLDLDLLDYGDLVLQSDELTLPHPRAHLRAFVLLPLAEIDPMLSLAARGPIGPWIERAAGQAIERITAA
jgi:2-amino-4-hydroxy-6-hydroxymethyldihydropteridine diphosphokinase